jgi:hypothetical protein
VASAPAPEPAEPPPPAAATAPTCPDACAQPLAQAQALLQEADASRKPGSRLRAAEALATAAEACSAKDAEPCDGVGSLRADAVRALVAAGREDRALRMVLGAREPSSPEVIRDLAAKTEQRVAADPKAAWAAEALRTAVFARLAGDDPEGAAADAKLYQKQFSGALPGDGIEIAAAIAAYWNDHDQAQKAVRALRATRPAPDAPMRARILWYSELGRAQRGAQRQKQCELVRTLWTGLTPEARSQLLDAPAADPIAGRARVMNAVGAAYFYLAEPAAQRAHALAFPRYRGRAEKEGVTRFISGPVKEWLEKKRALVEQAMKGYQEIVNLQPAPPPRWMVAAACEAGKLWLGLYDPMVTSMPVPRSFSRDPELQKSFRAALEEAAEPVRQQARGAFETCRDYAAKYSIDDQYSRFCGGWLDKNPAGDRTPARD